MPLFKRKQTTYEGDMSMPQELQDYYAAENRSQGWMAWVLGLITLVITVAVALGLFYGGRYAYRKVRGNDKPQTAQNDTTEDENSGSDEAKQDASSDDAASSTTATNTNTPQTSSTSTSTPGTATTPAVAGNSTNIPSTGPESTLAVFVTVSLLGYLLHRRFATK